MLNGFFYYNVIEMVQILLRPPSNVFRCGMNLSENILSSEENLSAATASDDHALLNLMPKEDVTSKEYHQAFLHEKDSKKDVSDI